MKELFDKLLMYFCFAGIGTIAVVAFVRVTLPAAATKARGVARQARQAGPAVIIPILCVAGLIVYGSTKSNSPTNEPPAQTQMIMQPGQLVEQRLDKLASEVVVASPVQKVGEAALQSVESVEPPASNALVRVEKWWRRGAYNDGQILTFDEDWCFPYGTNHLTSVEVWASGAVYASMKAPSPIVELATRLSVAPQDTEVYMGRTTNNTYRIEWHGGHPNRDPSRTAAASIELFRNGNIIVTEGGVEAVIPYEPPFEHIGYGQNDDWVRANFTNAEEIVSIGYANWVDQQIGFDQQNGLYKFSAEFLDDPSEPTQLYIGDYSVCVTNAGVYSFILEKGTEYEFGTWPFNDDVDYWAQDDMSSDAPMLSAWWGGWESPSEWTIDGGWNWLYYPYVSFGQYYNGYCSWLPTFQGSPSLHSDDTMTFPRAFSVLFDYPNAENLTYYWSSSDRQVQFSDPYSQSTMVFCDQVPRWGELNLSVSTYVGGREFYSSLTALYGTNTLDRIGVSCCCPEFLDTHRNGEPLTPITFVFNSPESTNGVVRATGWSNSWISLYYDKEGTEPVGDILDQALIGVSHWERTFYAKCESPSSSVNAGEIGCCFIDGRDLTEDDIVRVSFTVIDRSAEPIISRPKTDSYPTRYYNPCCAIPGSEVYLCVTFNPDAIQDSQVRWRCVSGDATFISSPTGREVSVRMGQSTAVFEIVTTGILSSSTPMYLTVRSMER